MTPDEEKRLEEIRRIDADTADNGYLLQPEPHEAIHFLLGLVDEARAQERERCARVLEDLCVDGDQRRDFDEAAAAIRALGDEL